MGKLWYGGRIYTLQQEHHQVEAVFTNGSKIIAIGSLAEIENRYRSEIKESVDLKGSTMLPGFVDSHVHLIGHGERLLRLDLSHMQSKDEVLSTVENYAKEVLEGEWIIGEGWNEFLWENPVPITREDLDQIVPNHPVLLKRICRHVLVANSLALNKASIDELTLDPAGGVIGRDPNGRLNGLLKDQAQDLLTTKIPKVTSYYIENCLRTAIKDAYRLGLTGVHTEDLNYYNGFRSTFDCMKKVINKEGLRFRTHLLVHYGVMNEFEKYGGSYLQGNEWLEFGAIKIFADGSLGGRTALLSYPYADDPTTNGLAIFSQHELDDLVREARRLEMPVAIHAIGDQAFDMALTSIERNPLAGKGRDRLIHAEILRNDLIERALQLPLTLDIQPGFVASDFPWVIDRVGQKNMEYNFAWKTLLTRGLSCAGGSDAPIEPLSPLLGIHTAVNRTKREDSSKTVYMPEEVLTPYEAVCLYTCGSAYAACHEQSHGEINVGFLADFTILKEDIFVIDREKIADVKIDKTVIGGEIVYNCEKSKE